MVSGTCFVLTSRRTHTHRPTTHSMPSLRLRHRNSQAIKNTAVWLIISGVKTEEQSETDCNNKALVVRKTPPQAAVDRPTNARRERTAALLVVCGEWISTAKKTNSNCDITQAAFLMYCALSREYTIEYVLRLQTSRSDAVIRAIFFWSQSCCKKQTRTRRPSMRKRVAVDSNNSC